jgi:hypothetical protein
MLLSKNRTMNNVIKHKKFINLEWMNGDNFFPLTVQSFFVSAVGIKIE